MIRFLKFIRNCILYFLLLTAFLIAAFFHGAWEHDKKYHSAHFDPNSYQNVVKVTVLIDPAVPLETIKKYRNIDALDIRTDFSNGPLGMPQLVASHDTEKDPNQYSYWVEATWNAEYSTNLLLQSIVPPKDGVIVLSAESTAVAYAYTSLPLSQDELKNIPLVDFDKAARASKHFPDLLKLINESLQNGAGGAIVAPNFHQIACTVRTEALLALAKTAH